MRRLLDFGAGRAYAAIRRAWNRTWSGVDTSGTPGNATVDAYAGIAAWAGAATQCVITNPKFKGLRDVTITPIEPTGALATTRVAQIDPVSGSFTANRSTGSLANQRFSWSVKQDFN